MATTRGARHETITQLQNDVWETLPRSTVSPDNIVGSTPPTSRCLQYFDNEMLAYMPRFLSRICMGYSRCEYWRLGLQGSLAFSQEELMAFGCKNDETGNKLDAT